MPNENEEQPAEKIAFNCQLPAEVVEAIREAERTQGMTYEDLLRQGLRLYDEAKADARRLFDDWDQWSGAEQLKFLDGAIQAKAEVQQGQ